LSLAAVGEKIQTFVDQNKTKVIVGVLVAAAICVAAVAGLTYQYGDQIKTSVVGKACEVATPLIEYRPPWKRNPKNEATGVEYTDEEMKVFREDGTLPPLDSGVSQGHDVDPRHFFAVPTCSIGDSCVNWDEFYLKKRQFRKMWDEELMLVALCPDYKPEAYSSEPRSNRNEKNMSSGDRGKDNQRRHAREVAEENAKEIRRELRNARTDIDREKVIWELVTQRDDVDDNMLDVEKHGSETNKELYDELDRQYRKLSYDLFKMYDMYDVAPGAAKRYAAKVSGEAVPFVNPEDKGKAEVLKESVEIKGFAPSVTPLFSQGLPASLPLVQLPTACVTNPQPVWVQPVAPVNPPLCGWEREAGKQFDESKPLENAQSKRKQRKRSRGKKGKKQEATPTTQLRELKDHIDRLEQQLSDAPMKKSFKEALNTPAPVKQKKAKEEKKEAEKPKRPKKKDFERKCGNCGSKDHFTNQCGTLPQGWVKVPEDKWKAMSSAEKRVHHFKNAKLLKSYKPQSLSKHNPIQGSARFHDNLVPIFNPRAGNSGVDSEFWGTMLCAMQDGTQFVWITEHQLVQGVYYRGSDNKVYLLPEKDKWTILGFGNISQCRIPKAKLPMLAAVPKLRVEAPNVGNHYPCMYIGLSPLTMQREFCATTYSWDGKPESSALHSATTSNFSCGSFLYDSERECVIASHHGTIGPDSKLGENNLCSPLKAMGPRQ